MFRFEVSSRFKSYSFHVGFMHIHPEYSYSDVAATAGVRRIRVGITL